MRVEVYLRKKRKAAERLMTDTCVVRRGGGEQVYDRETGQYVDSGTTVYEGKARLQSMRAQAANPNAGELVFTVERVELQLPFGTTFEVGDVAEFTSSATNPDLVSEKYRIVGLGRKTHATAQRFDVEVLS